MLLAYIGSAGVLPVMLGTSELELPAAAFQGLESLQPLVLTLLSDQQWSARQLRKGSLDRFDGKPADACCWP